MNLKQIETFVWVATLLNFRKAAEQLNSSQPAVSSRIAALEATFGVQLFARQSGRIELTAKGAELLPIAKKLLILGDRFQTVACGDEAVSGVVRLGVSETIVQTWLPEFLRRVRATLPQLDLQLTIDVTSNMRDELLARSLDLAFLMGPVSDYRMENRSLCSFPMLWVCSTALDIPDGPVAVEALVDWPIVTFARSTRPFAEVEALARRDEIESLRLIPIASLAAGVRIVEDGIGVGVLPAAVVRASIARGRLRRLDVDWAPSDLLFTASFPREPFNPRADQLVELALEASTTGGFS